MIKGVDILVAELAVEAICLLWLHAELDVEFVVSSPGVLLSLKQTAPR